MASNRQYQMVVGQNPKRSAFDISYSKIFNCKMGQLIPVLHDEMVPGDVFHIGNEIVVRFNPLVAPLLHEVNCYVHYFFVPYRLLWDAGANDNWEDFITGGEDGTDSSSLPRWDNHSDTALYSLWDYFGFPTGVTVPNGHTMAPLDFPKRAYNLIWNNWYRDEVIQTEVTVNTGKDVKNRNWGKDYFTVALSAVLKGTAPSLPITGTGQAIWDAGAIVTQNPVGSGIGVGNAASEPWFEATNTDTNANLKAALEDNTVDMSNASTVDIAGLRSTLAIQHWMELNNRGGSRYVEWLSAHWGVAPTDARLQLPEYISGTKQSIVISEVINTSATATEEQGNLAGHGLSADASHVGSYKAKEYGIIMGLLSVMPKRAYGDGIDRQWLRQTRYDFPHPLFANLAEQGIYTAELYMDGSSTDDDVFGYQGRFDEARSKKDMYCGDMRSTYDYWHLGTQFSSAPTLNDTFLKCDPRTDIFSVTSEPGVIVHINNKVTAVRPLPVYSTPGLGRI